MRRLQLLLISCVVGAVVGCASSVVVVTGAVHPAIDITDVRIVSVVPEKAEEIALIRASSGAGFTDQQCYDYAVEELKTRAANLGGNVVVIEGLGSHLDGYIYNNGFITPNESQCLSGKVYFAPNLDEGDR